MAKTNPRVATAAEIFKLSEEAASFRARVRRATRMLDSDGTINDLAIADVLDEVGHVEEFLYQVGQAVERGTFGIEEVGQEPRPMQAAWEAAETAPTDPEPKPAEIPGPDESLISHPDAFLEACAEARGGEVITPAAIAEKKRARKTKAPKPEPKGLAPVEISTDEKPAGPRPCRAELVEIARTIFESRPNDRIREITPEGSDDLTVLALLRKSFDWGSRGGGGFYSPLFSYRVQGEPEPQLWGGPPPYPEKPDAEGMELVAIVREALAGPAAEVCPEHRYDVYLPADGEQTRGFIGVVMAPNILVARDKAQEVNGYDFMPGVEFEVTPSDDRIGPMQGSKRQLVKVRECCICFERWPAADGVGCPKCIHGPAEIATIHEAGGEPWPKGEPWPEGMEIRRCPRCRSTWPARQGELCPRPGCEEPAELRREPLPGQTNFLEPETEPEPPTVAEIAAGSFPEPEEEEGAQDEGKPGGGYDPTHPWFYKCGGTPPPAEAIVPPAHAIESRRERIVGDFAKSWKPAKVRAELEKLRALIDGGLALALEQWEALFVERDGQPEWQILKAGEKKKVVWASSEIDDRLSGFASRVMATKADSEAFRLAAHEIEERTPEEKPRGRRGPKLYTIRDGLRDMTLGTVEAPSAAAARAVAEGRHPGLRHLVIESKEVVGATA